MQTRNEKSDRHCDNATEGGRSSFHGAVAEQHELSIDGRYFRSTRTNA